LGYYWGIIRLVLVILLICRSIKIKIFQNSWSNFGGGLAVVRSPVQTLPPREYGGALVVWPGMPFPNLDGRIHQSPFQIWPTTVTTWSTSAHDRAEVNLLHLSSQKWPCHLLLECLEILVLICTTGAQKYGNLMLFVFMLMETSEQRHVWIPIVLPVSAKLAWSDTYYKLT
jgi:hypothetical protein